MPVQIVIPLFNREREIVRALASCLREIDQEFEIIVVDDASSDNSVAAVQPFLSNPQIKLIISQINRGEWGAGRRASQSGGESGSSGSIATMNSFLEDSRQSKPRFRIMAGFRSLGFEYVYDVGGNSPSPRVPGPTRLDLSGYVRWFADVERSDALWVTRRETFDVIPLPQGRNGHLLYAFGFNSKYRTLLLPIPAGTVHTDSGNH